MKVGDLVRMRNTPHKDLGIVLEINEKFGWAEVWWCEIGDSWAFFAEDLEVYCEKRK
tara:strand:+ start:502 stop:672 length:171 start_codon:yes stop_codon:yes gene_type:complete